MAKFTNCLQIVNAMPQQDQDALLSRLDELQAQGMSPKEAQLQAAIDVLARVEREGQIRKSADRYVTQQEISEMERQAFARLREDPGYQELTAKIAEAEEAGRSRFNQVVDKAVEMLKSRPGFKKISEEFDEKTVRNLAQVFIDDADATVPEATPSLGDATRARQDYVERFLKDAGIPEPREFWERSNQDRGYYNSPAFRRWFKDSKAVDANGRPLVAFHVTTNDFAEFDTGAGKTRGQKSTAAYSGQLGSWFTAPSLYSDNYEPGNAEAAVEGFVENSDGSAKPGAVTMPVHLSIQNPMEYSDFESMLEDRDSHPSIAKFKDDLVAQGYDGIVIRNSDTDGGVDRDDWVAFEPTQVKSAIGNRGQFDPNNPDIRKSSDRITNSANFKRWSGGAPVIELGDKHEFRSGRPVVVEALHGTTNADLTEFKRERANIESDMGAGFYASNTPEDVARNYANVDGPDLTQRVELLAERLEEDFDGDMDAAREEARKRLSEGAPNTLKLYVRFKNPAVLGGRGETYLDFNEAFDEETEEYGEATGLLVDFVEALRSIAPGFNASDRDVETTVDKLFASSDGEGISASEAHDIIKNELMDAYDDEGGNATNEIFRQALSQIGFDGVIDTTVYGKFGPRMIKGAYTPMKIDGMGGMTPDTVHFIAFEPEQIKSATGNSGEFGENREILKSVDRPQFYSQLQRAIEGVPDRLSNMAAPQWKLWLDSNGPKAGVKKDEIEWSGIKDYLDLQGKKKLSKGELSAYLDESGVKVSEVVLGSDSPYKIEELEYGEYPFAVVKDGEELERFKAEWQAQEFIEEQGDDAVDATKYAQYTLPGGENYREVLITLPASEPPATREQFSVFDESGELISQGMWPPSARTQAKLDANPGWRVERETVPDQNDARRKGLYQSSHWDEPNVLAHIRINDRTDADGNKVLFVEEIQSDWGQEGKKKGFSDPKASDRLKYAQENFVGLVPAAPFVTKTEGWLNLALKRIAMMAVEGGYDKVAFVNGEQSADRYDLSKQVSEVIATPYTKSSYTLMVKDNNGRVTQIGEKTVDELPDVVGKELAEKIVASNGGSFKGLDLKVGGEGMKTFYDKLVPQAVNKLLPKLGGEKLGEVRIPLTTEQSTLDVVGEDGELILRTDYDSQAYATARENPGSRVIKTPSVGSAPAQPGFDVTDKMRETVGAGVPLFSRDRTETAEFKKWFGDSKVVDADGKPLVVYRALGEEWDDAKSAKLSMAWASESAEGASEYVEGQMGGNVAPVFMSLQNPADLQSDAKAISIVEAAGLEADDLYEITGSKEVKARLQAAGYDGIRAFHYGNQETHYAAFRPEQIKSAIGNSGAFDPTNPDIRKSADRPWFEDLSKLKVSTNYQLGDLLKSSKKLNWWNRTVGTQYNLAQKNPEFKRVFDAVQTFINDVSAYATQAADLAPNILPKLDGIRDVLKKPLSAEDVKALRDPVFGGTLKYMRDENGEIVETDDVQAAGVVFTDEELRDMFGLNDRQIGLYREFRQATDRSLTDLALSDMIRYIGEDGVDIREAVMASSNVDVGAGIIESHLEQLAGENPGREESLNATIEAIRQKAEQASRLMDRGYAPLSRFGQYTVYAVGKNGEQLYFGMFETQRDANKMAREMADQYPDAEITTGTMSQESYKLFSGVTPETLALFGESLGLEENGIDPRSEAFQQYLKLAKTNRSAMKRLIERKGIDGFSEDAGRVLAGFVYSNARQVSTNLHAGEISRSASEIKDGDVKDHAIRLMEYIQNPTEEAQKLKALLFTTFLGGNISSAIVNFTQTATTTFPYLSQFDGAGSVMKRLGDAVKLAARGIRNDDELKQALKRAEDEGVVSPQEVFHLMAQAQGRAQLQTGDGTRVGDALAKTNNFMTKATLAWGRLFSAAEQANRRIAFIAAYKLARDKGMANPFEFAEKAVLETQFSTNKGIRPAWARGAVGGVLFTFKGFTISYLELLGRMLGNGPEGKKAFGLALGTLFLFAGAGGMPFVDDLDDVVDGFAQRVLGKSFDSKQAKKEFFASIFGQTGAEFVMGGLTSLPGAPIDLSGRLGLGNIIPGTGIAPKKASYQRDAMEIFGPAGSLFSNYAMAIGMLAQGEVGSAAAQAAPLGIQNLIKGMDMAQMGFYRDTKGRKVIDTNGWEAAAKVMGFQPASVKRIQDATSTQQGLIAQNKLRETEIADKMARARIERKPELAQEAREELAEWNRKNPESPIRIDQSQINRRVQQAMMDKAKRIEKTAPKEIRQSVARELERAN